MTNLNAQSRQRLFIIAGVVVALLLVLALIKFLMGPKNPIENEEEAKAWNFAKSKNTEYFYKKFVADYPTTKVSAEIESRIADSLKVPDITLESLVGQRLTGKIDQFGDKKAWTVLFKEIKENGDVWDFVADVNCGPIHKQLNGSIVKTDKHISFTEDPNSGNLLNLKSGRMYTKNDKVFAESTDLEQYWILE
jgi:hypothetical protein